MDDLLDNICRFFQKNGHEHPIMKNMLQELVKQRGMAPTPPSPTAGGEGSTARITTRARKANIETT